MDIRPKPEDCLKWAEGAGFSGAVRYDLKPYHYGIVLIKGGLKDENRSYNFDNDAEHAGTRLDMLILLLGRRMK